MQCMKCGRELENERIFCDICLADMEKYPVKPGTVVMLPHYQPHPAPKRVVKRTVPVEEQLRRAKKRNWILALLLTVSMLVSLVFGCLALYLYAEYDGKFLPGQNYSAIGEHHASTPEDEGSDSIGAE